jgi:hypothetical protein
MGLYLSLAAAGRQRRLAGNSVCTCVCWNSVVHWQLETWMCPLLVMCVRVPVYLFVSVRTTSVGDKPKFKLVCSFDSSQLFPVTLAVVLWSEPWALNRCCHDMPLAAPLKNTNNAATVTGPKLLSHQHHQNTSHGDQ